MLVKQFEVGRFNLFTYLIADEEVKEGLFIDPADGHDLLLQEAEAYGLTIKYIVNTHHHIDHVMGNMEMAERTGAKTVIHKDDAPLMHNVDQSMLRMFKAELPPPADITVSDGDLIKIGNVALKVIHTPGHTPGGMCLYIEAAPEHPGMLFTGDTLFVGTCGRTDFPGGSFEQLKKSVTTRIYTLPGETVLLPGHNYTSRLTSTVEQERRSNDSIRDE